MSTLDIEPPAPTIARAEAGSCGDSDGSDIDTFGTVEYPTPPVPPIEIRTIPFFPSDLIRAVAAAPTPPPPDICHHWCNSITSTRICNYNLFY